MKIASSMTAIRMKGRRSFPPPADDEEEDGGDGDGVDYLEVVVRSFDHVLHARGLADEHTGRIIFLQDGVQLIDLLIDIIEATLYSELMSSSSHLSLLRIERTESGRHLWGSWDLPRSPCPTHTSRPCTCSISSIMAPDVAVRQVGVHQQHMGGGDVKLLGELAVCDNILHVLRQALAHVVVYFVVRLIIADVGRGATSRAKITRNTGKIFAHALGKAVPSSGMERWLVFCRGLSSSRMIDGRTVTQTAHRAGHPLPSRRRDRVPA